MSGSRRRPRGAGEIEGLGVRAGLARGEVSRAFPALAGDVWIGELLFAGRPPYRLAIAPVQEAPDWVAVDLEEMP